MPRTTTLQNTLCIIFSSYVPSSYDERNLNRNICCNLNQFVELTLIDDDNNSKATQQCRYLVAV